MLKQIQGLHHVTSMASDANVNNRFFTNVLGLRRVKKTVNFDRPDVYHLYYGDEVGSPGSVMTYFPFPGMPMGERGTGEVGVTALTVPEQSLEFWENRFLRLEIADVEKSELFGERRLSLKGPDGDGFALVESADDDRQPWLSNDIPTEVAIRGFHSASLRLKDNQEMQELLGFMNYEVVERSDNVTRLMVNEGNGASVLDLEVLPAAEQVTQGAGSVHHIAFSVESAAAQLEVREALIDNGYAVTPVIDRDYFLAIYFRTPDGILFEVATDEPGFDRDETSAELGTALKLPAQHEHLRAELEKHLDPIKD
ncbi:MAG: VOC family protein [Pseudomonadota bacterium]